MLHECMNSATGIVSSDFVNSNIKVSTVSEFIIGSIKTSFDPWMESNLSCYLASIHTHLTDALTGGLLPIKV